MVETPSNWLQGFEQSHMESCMAHAKGWGHLSKLNDSRYFSTCDLCTGYHHILLDEDSIPKTAFTSPFGKFEYLKVPFGLAQAPAYFQELMNKVLKDLLFTSAYLVTLLSTAKWQKNTWTIRSKFPQTSQCRTIYEIEQVPLLCQRNSIFGPYPQHYWFKAPIL